MSTLNKSDVGDDPELLELQTSFTQQQAKITALREIIRQTEVVNDMKNATAQEKVKNIAQRLTHFKTKVTTSRMNRANSATTSLHLSNTDPKAKHPGERTDAPSTSFQRGRSESSSIEKCSLLRQQMEKNRQKMAERESCKREIEEKVIEIKHKLETTQQTLEKTTELDRTRSYIDGLDLITPVHAEQSVHDQSERHDASINPTNRSSDNTLRPSSTAYGGWQDSNLPFNKESSQYSTTFAEPVITPTKNDDVLHCEVNTLKENLQEKNGIIDRQFQVISQLVRDLIGFETARANNVHHDIFLVTELQRTQLELLQKAHNLSLNEAEDHLHDNYGYDPVAKITEKLGQMCNEKENIKNVENKKDVSVTETDAINLCNALEKIDLLEQTIAMQDVEMEKLHLQMTDLRHSLEEKTIELNVMTANVSVLQEKLKNSGPKPLFPRSAEEEIETESSKLKQQLDESNKTMIKCKLRIKQLQKQVDTFKKTSNVHEEVARLTEELHVLSTTKKQERKTSLSTDEVFTERTTLSAETQKRLEMLELTCQNQASAMQLLEEQKNDLSEDLFRTRNELQSLNERAAVTESGENGRIASQMLSIELEEQLETCLADKTELTKVLHTWEAEKCELQQKLKQCMEENAELLCKIEKLSIEKVSSAESIEILENLTLNEKREMEKSEKRALGEEDETDGQSEGPVPKENLNDSLFKLMEESKELMDKVEMFTDERREVLEKLDAISIENQAYLCELDKLKEANEQLRGYSVELASAKTDLEEKLRAINDEKETILHELDTVRVRKPGEQDSALTAATSTTVMPLNHEMAFTVDAYEQALVAVENEVSTYNKSKDKQKKLQVSKKLTTNAKNLITMSKQLLNDHSSCLLERALLGDRIASLSQQIHTLQHAEDASSYETQKNVASVVAEKPEMEVGSEKSSDDEPELLKVELNSKNEEIVELKRIMEAQAKGKATELLLLQQQLLDAQSEVLQLQLQATQAEELRAKCNILHAERDNSEKTVNTLKVELQRSNEIVDQKMNVIATLEARIVDLSQSTEDHLSSRTNIVKMKQRIEELTDQLSTRVANEESDKAELEQKNQELLDKLKKFAANLKRKNVSYNELEQEHKQLAAAYQQLTEQQERMTQESLAKNDTTQLQEENEALAQKLHHLNNELHRLLEQKYQLESNLRTSGEEVTTLKENMRAAQEEQSLLTNRLLELEEQLETQRLQLEADHNEIVSKNGKIEKCKAIIKEKIKETHRLQEHERRTSYLEDELRMTQSKLEDFHNQTLLLGRLKNEKEELNALVKAGHAERRTMEQLLSEKEEELQEVRTKQYTASESLQRVESWVRWLLVRWAPPSDENPPVEAAELGSITLLEWYTLLAYTEHTIAKQISDKTDELCAINQRLQEAEQKAGLLYAEMEQTKVQLIDFQTANSEQKQTIVRITQELEQTQNEMQQVINAHSQMAEQQSELQVLQTQLEEVGTLHSFLENSLAAAERVNAEQSQEVEQLREMVASCQQKLQQEKANANDLMSAYETLQNELELQRNKASELERKLHELQSTYETFRQEGEMKLVQWKEDAQAREGKLNDELRRKDVELDSMREDYDEQLVKDTQTKDQLSETLRQKDHELEVLRKEYDGQLMEETQTKEQLSDALTRKNEEFTLLRKDYEEQLAELTITKKQFADACKQKDQELESLRKDFEEQVLERTQSKDRINEAVRRKDEQLEALRNDYEMQLTALAQIREQIGQKDQELESLSKAFEVQQMEQTQTKDQMNVAIQRKDEELVALRKNCEEQLVEQTQASELVRQKGEELASLCKNFEEQLLETARIKDQLNDDLRRKDEELESLHRTLRELSANKPQTKEQLEELLDEELETLRQDYEEQLMEVKHSKGQLNEALERKEKELESLRKTYKECCEQQDVLGRRHFQEQDALQQKLLESVGERVTLQQSIDSMTRAAEDQASEISRLRARVGSLEKQTSENLTNTSILSSLNEALNEELDQLQERMHAAEGGPSEMVIDPRNLESVIHQKNEIIEQLGIQQKLMQQEITDLKIKAGKLLRKLKETRAKCDVLEAANAPAAIASATVDGWEVEAGPSELMKEHSDNRVHELESRLKKGETERVTLLREKDALLAKLDTLETACEKLTELKEHQDRQIEMLRNASQEQELRDRLQHTTATLQTRESEVIHLNAQLQQLTGAAETADRLRAQLHELENAVPDPKPVATLAELQIVELERTNRLLEEEKAEMSRELEALNQQILHDLRFEDRLHKAMLELDASNVELQMLRSTLEQMHSGGTDQPMGAVTVTTAAQEQIATLEARVLELEQQKAYYEQQLETPMEAVEYGSTVERASPLVMVATADRQMNADVREVLERQELEIVTLKEQLAVRSAEYARLAAHVDPTRLLALIKAGAPPPAPEQQQQSTDRDSRAELELALYMIYQRDMRCDELELELRNLLEERDALQLRLSNALRMHEEFRLKSVTVSSGVDNMEYGTSGECSIESSPERPAAAESAPADDPRPMSSMSTVADSADLSSKLSELHSISYSKEKRWQEEREDRNRQLTLIQRDLANMPLEAAAKITGTDVVADTDTSSQQSASSVLLNWILGKK